MAGRDQAMPPPLQASPPKPPPVGRAVTTSVANALARRREYFGPDILVIVGAVLIVLGVLITLLAVYVDFHHPEVYMLVMGTGPSLLALGGMFCLLRLLYFRPKWLLSCWDRCRRSAIMNMVHPAQQQSDSSSAGAVKVTNTGMPNPVQAIPMQQRSSLRLDASVLLASSTSRQAPRIGTTTLACSPAVTNDLSSKANTPGSLESAENNDNELTESLLNAALGEDIPFHVWNIPVDARYPKRPRTAPLLVSPSYVLTPVEDGSLMAEKMFLYQLSRRRSYVMPFAINKPVHHSQAVG